MQILSHRGYWKTEEEKNTETAFRHSFQIGFGTETDVRDLKGELVISHDMPKGGEMTFEKFLQIYCEYDKTLPLAINIKADGLGAELKRLFEKYDIQNYFLFDMSVPDLICLLREELKCFTRESEYEIIPSCYEESEGVWVDCFKSDWIEEKDIKKHLDAGKKVCIVSPDLHKRDYRHVWGKYKKFDVIKGFDLMLCTDIPEDAKKFFMLK
ncbi:MAG: hypothetical protein ACD_20C00228G0007 [uncultured bacterium]|nr:MAG: hypothetical protein ACD_20C00228G0007 [uncultured bacterium]